MRIDAKTSRNGRMTIPRELRGILGLEPGGVLQFVVEDNGEVFIEAKSPIADVPASSDAPRESNNN
jgi:AbrB family looped-hinge helix DNA binding protein